MEADNSPTNDESSEAEETTEENRIPETIEELHQWAKNELETIRQMIVELSQTQLTPEALETATMNLSERLVALENQTQQMMLDMEARLMNQELPTQETPSTESGSEASAEPTREIPTETPGQDTPHSDSEKTESPPKSEAESPAPEPVPAQPEAPKAPRVRLV